MSIAARIMQRRVAIYIRMPQQRALRRRACRRQPISARAGDATRSRERRRGGEGVGRGQDRGGRHGGEVGAGPGRVGREGQEDLEAGVVAAEGGEHDGVAAADILALDAGLGRVRGRAQVVDDVRVALARGEHEGRLVVLVERDAGALVAELEEQGGDGEVPELRGQVQRGVGEPEGRVVRVVEEGGV